MQVRYEKIATFDQCLTLSRKCETLIESAWRFFHISPAFMIQRLRYGGPRPKYFITFSTVK